MTKTREFIVSPQRLPEKVLEVDGFQIHYAILPGGQLLLRAEDAVRVAANCSEEQAKRIEDAIEKLSAEHKQ